MTFKESVASALQAFALLLVLSATAFFFALPSAPELRVLLADAILNQSDLFYQAGIVGACLSVLFFFGFYGINRGYYLVLKMGRNALSVDEKVLFQTLEPELRKKFDERLNLEQVSVIGKKQLAFTMTSPKLSAEEQEELLLAAEEHLETVLKERFGYRKIFTVRLFPRAT